MNASFRLLLSLSHLDRHAKDVQLARNFGGLLLLFLTLNRQNTQSFVKTEDDL